MSVKAFVGVIGLVVLGVGLYLGLQGHIVDAGNYRGIRCGSAFNPMDRGIPAQAVSVCEGARPSAALLWAVVAVGAIALLGALVIKTQPKATTA